MRNVRFPYHAIANLGGEFGARAGVRIGAAVLFIDDQRPRSKRFENASAFRPGILFETFMRHLDHDVPLGKWIDKEIRLPKGSRVLAEYEPAPTVGVKKSNDRVACCGSLCLRRAPVSGLAIRQARVDCAKQRLEKGVEVRLASGAQFSILSLARVVQALNEADQIGRHRLQQSKVSRVPEL